MSLLSPCTSCGSRAKGKNAWLCWAWNRADNQRVAYIQKLCLGCVSVKLVPILIGAEIEELVCPQCHTDPGEQLDPIYLSYILPGAGQVDVELATCGPCAVEVRIFAQEGSAFAQDRHKGVGAEDAAPTQPAVSAWDALGLRPDARSGGRHA